jgi:exosome complex RNA-binding protein Rrp4
MNLPTVTIREFARIVGVDHAAVVRAVQGGTRLTNSVIRENGKVRIVVAQGCYEWIMHKEEMKDSRERKRKSRTAGVMPRDVSAEMDRHYAALMKRMEFEKACNHLVPVATSLLHMSEALRTFRDTMMNIPLVVSELSRPIMLGILREDGDDISPAKHKLIDDAVLQIRQASKREVRKAINQAADIIDDERKRDEEKRLNDECMNGV